MAGVYDENKGGYKEAQREEKGQNGKSVSPKDLPHLQCGHREVLVSMKILILQLCGP